MATALVEDMKSRNDLDVVFKRFNNENSILAILKRILSSKETAIKHASYLYQNNPDDTIKNELDKLIAEKTKIESRLKRAESTVNILNIGNLNKISKKLKKTLIEADKIEILNYI